MQQHRDGAGLQQEVKLHAISIGVEFRRAPPLRPGLFFYTLFQQRFVKDTTIRF
jgi:hypothetical protein